MNAIQAVRSFARFWYDFVVGDDWRVALGVALALVATWGAVQGGLNAWWLLPLCTAALLVLSLALVVRAARRD